MTNVLSPTSPLLFTWRLPGVNRRFTLRRDAYGFILMCAIAFFNALVERLDPPGNEAVDEGGFNHRHIAGKSAWSLHAYGRAVDLNWNRHPSGVATRKTYTAAQTKKYRNWLKWINRYAGGKLLEWGGDWPSHDGSRTPTDSMHTQVNDFHATAVKRVAALLARSARGKAIIKANFVNKDYKKVLA